jgi:hypothetical protein
VVTENVNGKAVVQSDEPLPAYEFKTVPGYEHTLRKSTLEAKAILKRAALLMRWS